MDHSLSRDTQSLQRCSVSLITQAKNALLNIIHMPVTILFHYWSMVHFCHLQKNYTYSANYTKVVFEILIRTKCFREDGLFPCVAFWVGNLAALASDCKQMPRSTMEKHDGLQIVWTSDMVMSSWRLETGDFIAAQYVTLSEIQYEQGIISFLSKQVTSPENSSSSLQSPAYKEAGLFPASIIGPPIVAGFRSKKGIIYYARTHS